MIWFFIDGIAFTTFAIGFMALGYKAALMGVEKMTDDFVAKIKTRQITRT